MKPDLFYLLLALQAADIGTTWYGISKGAVEANTFLSELFAWAGKYRAQALIAAKLAVAGLLYWLYDQIQIEAFAGLCAFYVLILINNIRVIQKQRSA